MIKNSKKYMYLMFLISFYNSSIRIFKVMYVSIYSTDIHVYLRTKMDNVLRKTYK